MKLLCLIILLPVIQAALQFSDYKATGYIQLPYAEIKEPFTAYYWSSKNKSRVDLYNGTVKDIADPLNTGTYKIAPVSNDTTLNTITCLLIQGPSEEATIQGVLPTDLTVFKDTGTQDVVRGIKCNVWAYQHNVSNFTQVYELYVDKDKKVPVRLDQRGYNLVGGSHVDHYIVDYMTFEAVKNFNESLFDVTAIGNFKLSDCKIPSEVGHEGHDVNVFSELADGVHSHPENFDKFKAKFGKSYETKKEHVDRYATYINNIRYIHSMNRKGLSFKLGSNHMLDWSDAEHRSIRGKIYSTRKPMFGEPSNLDASVLREMPRSLDLRILGVIGPVKDQGVCGSCWSFATTGAIEAAYFAKHQYRVSLSEQNVMDCSWGHGNNGCDGGFEPGAYDWIIKNGGIAHEVEYGQYKMADGKCIDNTEMTTVKIKQYYRVHDTSGMSSNQTQLKLTFFTKQVAAAVNIDASHKSLSFYRSGVYYEKLCKNGEADLDHAVLAVGFGTLEGKDYWIVKNSWSTYWGNSGYVLMDMQDDNCGVTRDATFVRVK